KAGREAGQMTRWLILGTLAAATVFAGCSKEPVEPASPTNPAPVAPRSPSAPAASAAPVMADLSQVELDKVFKSPKPYRLALIVKTRNNPFFDPMIKAAEAKAREA